ncbi:MAG: hypothetical protein HY665_00950 [Chloroflexi bacterium]|nr:hypothetical protein [Chloroflexota bacterium]
MTRLRVIEAQDVGKLIKDGASVTVCGVTGTMFPELTLSCVEISFLTTGHPKDLTLVYPCPFGYSTVEGADHFAHEGLLKRVIGSSYHDRHFPKLCSLVREDKIEGYVLPLGVFYQLVRDTSAGLPGSFSYVGLGTIIDPRNDCGRLNSISKDALVELVNIQGREMLFYKAIPIDVAIIRGTTADEDGNISLEEEPVSMDTLHQAMAAHNNGGIVICQVRRLAAKGSIPPRMVEVPGILVDYIVVDPNQRQRSQFPAYDPGISGEIRVPEPPVVAVPMGAEKVISRRALMQLAPDNVVNLGAGIPITGGLPLVAREEGVAQRVHFSVEHGALGGVNLGSHAHVNPTSLLTATDIMDLYHGSGLDWSFLGFMEVDKSGNVNLGRLGKITEGPGGCIDISGCTKRVAFLGTFTYNGLKVEIGDGKLRIVNEGKTKKLVNQVQGIFYSSKYGRLRGQQITYITERAVFELRDEGIALVEVAPGIDIEGDVLGQMEFKPIIDKDLKQMNPDIFREPVVGIGNKMQ